MIENSTQRASAHSIWQSTRLLLKKSSILLLLSILSFTAFAQKVATGTIKDSNGAVLPGVGIKVKGTTTTATSNAEGQYSIKVDGGNAILIFTYIGSKVQEIAVGNQSVINATMEEEVSSFK